MRVLTPLLRTCVRAGPNSVAPPHRNRSSHHHNTHDGNTCGDSSYDEPSHDGSSVHRLLGLTPLLSLRPHSAQSRQPIPGSPWRLRMRQQHRLRQQCRPPSSSSWSWSSWFVLFAFTLLTGPQPVSTVIGTFAPKAAHFWISLVFCHRHSNPIVRNIYRRAVKHEVNMAERATH
jgi:hypothetical protein